MGFPLFVLDHFLLAILLAAQLMKTLVMAQDSLLGNTAEKDALYGLKATFNDPFLNNNWTGFPCNEIEPSRWFGVQCTSGRVTGIVLEGMGLTGKIDVKAFFNLTELSILSFKNNSLKGNVMDFSDNHHLKYIDLSGNEFDGAIPRFLLNLNFLEALLLQDNKLTGPVPEFSQPSLKMINVSGNDLHGRIRVTQTVRLLGPDSFSGNPRLCGPPLNSCSSSLKAAIPAAPTDDPENDEAQNQTGSSKKDNTSTILIIFNVVLLFAIIFLAFLYYKTVKKLNNIMKQQIPIIDKDVAESIVDKVEIRNHHSPVVMAVEEKKELIFFTDEPKFQMNELLKASAEALGQGIMGNSYKAMLNGGGSVVVKRLRDLRPMTREDFAKQLHRVADLRHLNLLPLLAYYISRDERLLLYRYAEKGNLFFRLHGNRNGNRIPFTWNSRLSVAKGVARGLTYLHLNAKPNSTMAPHGNLKSSNVLLDENDTVLISDYGLSSLIAQPIAAQRMVVYKSPEYGYSRKVSKQSDVWSYGSLLIELLTGRLSVCSAPPGVTGSDLSSWVHRAVREEWTAEIFDREISVQRNALPGMLRLLQIAMRCTDRFPENRPDMREVMREVEKIEVVPLMSEDEEDASGDRSITDDSLYSTSTTSGIIGDDR
ncbi:probable LRR receptor-like serine/threonine-protein kinase At4g31250 [Neltuma alba]|uniref:probable LRR receptor-like serine/threonine-protein kinase At4g31250 n=1 Tax=Neltuma alba TaxID=207710 RepID=UPI0010A527F2|nr:probable LRR receptor-like serine/threonine-protein kinase At4g31250 [Prosopis alba]